MKIVVFLSFCFVCVVLNHGFIFNITIRIVLSCVIVKVVCVSVLLFFLFFANSTAVMLAISLCSWLLFVHIRQYL